MKSNFDKFPKVKIKGHCTTGWNNIGDVLQNGIDKKQHDKVIIAIECYHGVYVNEIETALQQNFSTAEIINSSSALKSKDDIEKMVYPFVTDDPVFGYMAHLNLKDFFAAENIQSLQNKIEQSENKTIIVYGIGASLIANNADTLVYADMPRWEIQLRFRNNSISNFGAENNNAEFSYQYKRSFFVD